LFVRPISLIRMDSPSATTGPTARAPRGAIERTLRRRNASKRLNRCVRAMAASMGQERARNHECAGIGIPLEARMVFGFKGWFVVGQVGELGPAGLAGLGIFGHVELAALASCRG